MSDADHHEPVRSCLGCRRRRASSALVRVTASTAGIVVDGPSSGRGAWLCRSDDPDDGDDMSRPIDGTCLEVALHRRAFARSWRRELRPGEDDVLRRRATYDGPARAH